MLLTKLQEAVSECRAKMEALERQYALAEGLEKRLRAMIAEISAELETDTSLQTIEHGDIHLKNLNLSGNVVPRDRIDDVVDILRTEGAPLHIAVIAGRLSVLTGHNVRRGNIEPGFNRHIATVKNRRIDKFGPSMFGLPEWKTKSHGSAESVQSPLLTH